MNRSVTKQVAMLMTAVCVSSFGMIGSAGAEMNLDLVSKPIPVLVPDPHDITKTTESVWTPPEKPTKEVYVCVSIPTMLDPYWIAADYGLVAEAQRLGIKLDILNAGSYKNLAAQINQLNDCAAKDPDAIVVAPISIEGVAPTIASLKQIGIPVINFLPRIFDGENLAGRVAMDYYQVGRTTAEYLKASVGDAEIKVALFPGPPGADWAVRTYNGFKDAIAGTKITLVTNQYGDTDKNTHYNLIADALAATPDLDWIIGNSVAADAAVGAIKAAGLDGKVKIGATYQSPPVREGLKNGEIEWALSDVVVWHSSIAVGMAALAAEGKLQAGADLWPVPQKLTKDNAYSPETAAGFAPDGFDPVFSVDP